MGVLTAHRAARLEAILRYLEDHGSLTTMWLANKLAVSERGIHRDLALLRDYGYRIDGSAGHGGGVMLRKTTPVAIQRLIEEVSVAEPTGGYNRTYHRHNR